jgi:hypothetical protein
MQKLNAYDEQQIEKTEKNLEYMKTVKKKLVEYRVTILRCRTT